MSRMKGVRGPLLALAAGIAVLAVVLAVVSRHSRPPAPSYAFDPSIGARITGLNISLEGDSVSLARDAGGRWSIVPGGAPADSARIVAVLDGLARLATDDPAALNPDRERLLEFGLAPENAKTVTMRLEDGSRLRVLIGYTAETDFASTYWKRPDRPEVYRTPGEIALDAASRADMWRAESRRDGSPVPAVEDVGAVPEHFGPSGPLPAPAP